MGTMSWDCGLKYLFSVPPALEQGGVSSLPRPDELSRLEMVQRLAKDGCRFLQNHNYRLPDRTAPVSLVGPLSLQLSSCLSSIAFSSSIFTAVTHSYLPRSLWWHLLPW